MRSVLVLFIVFASVGTFGQSRRVPPTGDVPTQAASSVPEVTVKQLFEEANGYIRAKAAEFDAKKVEFSDGLFKQTKLEQRQLAAKYAAKASLQKDLSADDRYYLGMLHWIAENLDGTLDNLQKFIASDSPETGRKQTARSVVTVVLAKQKKMPEAEAVLAEYLKNEPHQVDGTVAYRRRDG